MPRGLWKVLLALAALLSSTDAAAAPPAEDMAEDSEHTTEEMAEAREEFDSIDTNKDGFVTREEILEMEEVPEGEEIDEFFSTYDTDKDGKVTFDEIAAADAALRESAGEDDAPAE